MTSTALTPNLAPDSKAYLAHLLPVGACLYYLITKKSRSGMSREVRLFAVSSAAIQDITYRAAGLINRNVFDGSTFRINMKGVGYSVGAELTGELGIVLHTDRRALTCQEL